jgi:hypothetical protein
MQAFEESTQRIEAEIRELLRPALQSQPPWWTQVQLTQRFGERLNVSGVRPSQN